MNTSKIHLPVEQFSLKINWKLAEGLLYIQSYKKNAKVIRKGRKIRLGSVPLGVDPEKKGDYRSGHVPWGASRSELI